MERLDLIVHLVFANEKSFQNLNLQQTKNLLLTAKLAMTNQNILEASSKYKAWGMYSNVLCVLEDAVEALIVSRGLPEDIRAYKCLFSEADDMIVQISEICKNNIVLHSMLAGLIMAGHKENLYSQMQEEAENMQIQLHSFYEFYFIEKLGICKEIRLCMHDPHNAVFTNQHYEFLAMEKEQNKSMIQIYDDWRAELYTDDDSETDY